MSLPFSLLLFASLVASPLIAFCANNDPRIVKTVESHWREHADVRGWSDTRVEVDVVSAPENEPKCDKPPEVVVVEARTPRRMKLELRCGDVWRETVIARATLSARVLVAAQDIEAGATLSDTNLRLEERELGTTPEAIGRLDLIEGFTPRRKLREGTLLQARLLHEPVLVRRGQPVRIVARHGKAIAVETAGESLGNGKRGDTVRVRNAASGRTIEARVTGPDEVEPLQ
jgi:flagella basal body P-ring formation protein FlgA